MTKANEIHQIGRVHIRCVAQKQADSLDAARPFATHTANALSSFCHEKLPVLLDIACKKIMGSRQGSTEIISIDTLSIDLGQISFSQLEAKLAQKLEDSLRHAQYSTPPISAEEWFFRIVSDYLTTGISPWNSSKLSNQEWLDGLRVLCLNPEFDTFLYQLKEKQGDIIIRRLASLLNGLGLETEWNELYANPANLFDLGICPENHEAAVFMNNSIYAFTDSLLLVKNVGIVLLSHFLPTFFKNMQLLDENNSFLGDEERGQAVYIVQQLPNIILGKEEEISIEGDFFLSKLLCGYPINEALEPRVKKFPHGYKDEIENLLGAVFGQWDAIRNYSKGEFAEFFFQRVGVFKIQTEQSLHVEWQAEDEALNFIPWTFSIIQTPWMSNPLRIVWNI